MALLLGVASKFYTGPGRDFVDGHVLDFFGPLFMTLLARVACPAAPRWKIVAGPLAIVVALELLEAVHTPALERVRTTWLGAHVFGAPGSWCDWADLITYVLAAAVAAIWVTALEVDRATATLD